MLTEFKPIIFLLITALAFLCACGVGHKEVRESRILTVSLEPQRYLLERIAGPKWEVKTVLGKGEDPESFDPSLSDLKMLQDSRAFFKIGTLAFEERLEDRTLRGLNVIDTSTGIERINGTHSDCSHHDHEASGHNHAEADPHIWTSLVNARIMARNMLEAMIETDPADSAIYRSNFCTLMSELDSCHNLIAERLAPLKGASFLVWHPSLSYFARDYKLHQLTIGMDNKELSVRNFRHNIDRARNEGAILFFVQPDFDSGRSASIAEAAGTHNVTINTMAYNLPEELLRISKELKENQ